MKNLTKLSLTILLSLSLIQCSTVEKKPKYIFYFIGDGMGVNQVLGTQMYLSEKSGKIGVKSLSFSNFDKATTAYTYSRYNAVTCSAASGTALACGEKTKNGAIGMDSTLQNPLYSVAYHAKRHGKKIGIVTSVSVNHATPSAFYAHQPHRTMYDEIALDLTKSDFDFFAGSGFSRNAVQKQIPALFDSIAKAGYNITIGLESFDNISKNKSKIILIQDSVSSSLPYAIDRSNNDITLTDLTKKAISFLQNDKNGFFLMVEGGLIDWACHSNDAATVFREVEDFSESIQAAIDFYNQHPDETLIVITADHETGGIALGNGPYELHLNLLSNQNISQYQLGKKLSEMHKNQQFEWNKIKALLKEKLSFWDKIPITEQEEKHLFEVYQKTRPKTASTTVSNIYYEEDRLAIEAIKILNKKACVSWASNGHSAGLVPIYAKGVGSEYFSGQIENKDIPNKILSLIK